MRSKGVHCKKTREFDFPDKKRATDAFEHSAEKLVKVAELAQELDNELNTNADFAKFWPIVKRWNVDRRHETKTTYQEAADLLQAIEDPTNGVLQWLKKHW